MTAPIPTFNPPPAIPDVCPYCGAYAGQAHAIKGEPYTTVSALGEKAARLLSTDWLCPNPDCKDGSGNQTVLATTHGPMPTSGPTPASEEVYALVKANNTGDFEKALNQRYREGWFFAGGLATWGQDLVGVVMRPPTPPSRRIPERER